MAEFKGLLDLGALAASEGVVIKGANLFGSAGYAVAGGGDLNDDGYDDLVIGAPGAGATGRGPGAAFGMFGGQALSSTIDLAGMPETVGFRLDGYYRGGKYGSSVAIIGDFNADGPSGAGDDYDDIAIGAPQADFGDPNDGVVQVVYGRNARADWEATFSVLGYREGDRAGMSVAAVGDLDFDGLDDLLIGAPLAGSSGTIFDPFDYGRAYVLKGDNDPNLSGGLRLGRPFDFGYLFQADEDQDDFGWSVAGLGDVNGDFLPDLIIGAPRSDAAGENTGKSVVILGGFRIVEGEFVWRSSGRFEITGGGLDQQSGASVSSAGDLNGDGIGDIVIGAPAFGRGVAYVIYGQDTPFPSEVALGQMNGVHGFRIAGRANGDLAGSTVASAGDVNGDGYDDLIIGAPGRNQSTGSAYVLFGKRDFYSNLFLGELDGSNGFVIKGAAQGDKAGFSVCRAGDVNGDGFDDLIVGAPGSDIGAATSGAAYVIYGHRADEAVLRLGTEVSQTINGGRGDDTIDAFGDSDTLFGWEGNDTLQGGAGQDWLDGGAGRDQLRGGAGDDTYVVTVGIGGADIVDELPGEGRDMVVVTPGFILPGRGKPIPVGSYTLRANVEDARVEGVRGFNLTGNELANDLKGNEGANALDGRDGADTLGGGLGRDVLTGGAGADMFLFGRLQASAIDETRDVITDFAQGADRIDVSAIDARAGTPNANEAFAFIGLAQFTAEGQIRVTQSGDDAIVRLNTTGVSAAESTILLRNVDAEDLTAADFLL